MVLFHSYVSLPEGNVETCRKSPCVLRDLATKSMKIGPFGPLHLMCRGESMPRRSSQEPGVATKMGNTTVDMFGCHLFLDQATSHILGYYIIINIHIYVYIYIYVMSTLD